MDQDPERPAGSIRDLEAVRAEFDEIARLSPAAGRPDPLVAALLRHLPDPCGEVLEIGCGTGQATRMLAARARRVVAWDLSPRMIEVARARSAGVENIEYHAGDALRYDYPAARFDAVVSIATLHHLPLEPMVAEFRRTLRPGGVLLLLDLVDRGHPAYLPLNLAAGLSAVLSRLGEQGHSSELRRAYRQHGAHDRYLRPREAREVFGRLLPGSRFRHHLRWRYSVVWTKPAAQDHAPPPLPATARER